MTFYSALACKNVQRLSGNAERLMDEQGWSVMMAFEGPLMQAHAHAICQEVPASSHVLMMTPRILGIKSVRQVATQQSTMHVGKVIAALHQDRLQCFGM